MRTRIVRLAVWVSVLTIGLFGLPLAVAVLQYALATERTDLERVADAVAIAVSDEVVRDEPVEGIGRARSGDTADVGVYSENGERIAGDGPDQDEFEVARALAGKLGDGIRDGRLIVAVPITHDAEVIGAVRVTGLRSEVLVKVIAVWGAMAALAALVVGTVWLTARRQARRLVRPLERLLLAARRLGDGDFSVRTPPDDTPEIDAVGRALNDTAVRLDEMLARERAFSAEASHQLRTPLAGLRLRLEAALEQAGQDPRPAIAASLTDADRLEQTIDELLTLARDAQGARGRPVDLDRLLEEIHKDWDQRIAARGRRLDLRIDPRAPRPQASEAAVRQVLRVLVDNAAIHGAGTVTVTVRESADVVAIDVSDAGRGVREAETALFGRRTDRPDGHGIGLALARRLAEAEGGRLHLTRQAPPTFTLILPAAQRPTSSGLQAPPVAATAEP